MRSNQKGFSVVEILIVIAVVGVLGAVGWLVYDRQKNKADDKQVSTQTSQQEKQEEPKEETSTPNPYEGWKESSNEKWGFSFKYPAGWKVNTTESGYEASATSRVSVTTIGPSESKHDFMMVEVLDMTMVEMQSNQWFKDSNIFNPADSNRQQVKLGNYSGYRYNTYGQTDTAYYFYEVKGKLIVFMDNFGNDYKSAEAKLILESFKIN
jgi:prepilin-type N-terminal cleavage/methylation domain-containing protein